MQRLKPLNDFIFGKTFGEKGDEEQLLSLLNAILAKTKRKKLVQIEIVEHRTFTAMPCRKKTLRMIRCTGGLPFLTRTFQMIC